MAWRLGALTHQALSMCGLNCTTGTRHSLPVAFGHQQASAILSHYIQKKANISPADFRVNCPFNRVVWSSECWNSQKHTQYILSYLVYKWVVSHWVDVELTAVQMSWQSLRQFWRYFVNKRSSITAFFTAALCNSSFFKTISDSSE